MSLSLRHRANRSTMGGTLRSFGGNERGSIAIIAAIVIVPALFITGMSIDYGRAVTAQNKLQAAVDAAALATMNVPNSTEQSRIDIANSVFNANVAQDSFLASVVPDIDASAVGTTVVKAHASVPTAFLKFLQVSSIDFSVTGSASSEASARYLEVAMMIDLTGSMGSTRNNVTKIQALKDASADLLDIFFPGGATTSTTTKIAIAPMADFVNAGTYAAQVTGLASSGSYAKINNLGSTKTGTYGNLGYSGAGGGGSGQGFGANSNGGTYSSAHCTSGSLYQTVQGYTVGVANYTGASQGYYASYWKTVGNTKYYVINWGKYDPVYTSNCTPSLDQAGPLVTCVTERTGTDAYTDAAPASGSYIGAYNRGRTSSVQNYSSDGKCFVAGRELPAIIPLTNSRTKLEDFFDAATIGGGTPGHLGHAWAWYMLSPSWADIWPTESKPVAYNTANYTKAAIIMTDGEYNEQYSSETSRNQALALCSAMKAKGILVYTIGFGFSANPTAGSSEANAKDMLTQCASGSGHYFFPYDGTQLRDDFATIAGTLTASGPSKIRVTN